MDSTREIRPTFSRDELPLAGRVIVTDATTARTLALTDADKYIRCTSGSATAVTVPPQTDTTWLANTEIIVEQAGAGAVTITEGAGVTVSVNATYTLVTAGQYAVVRLKRVAEDVWVLSGDRVAA